eukprot:4650045-Prymnesium_polylepis.1
MRCSPSVPPKSGCMTLMTGCCGTFATACCAFAAGGAFAATGCGRPAFSLAASKRSYRESPSISTAPAAIFSAVYCAVPLAMARSTLPSAMTDERVVFARVSASMSLIRALSMNPFHSPSDTCLRNSNRRGCLVLSILLTLAGG